MKINNRFLQLLAKDLLGPVSMKNAAKCETSMRRAKLVKHWIFERNALMLEFSRKYAPLSIEYVIYYNKCVSLVKSLIGLSCLLAWRWIFARTNRKH